MLCVKHLTGCGTMRCCTTCTDSSGSNRAPKAQRCPVQGGVLYVRPRKAHNLVKKNFFKGGFMHSTATVRVSIAGQSKKTAQVDGSNPTFSDVLEFILGGDLPSSSRAMPFTLRTAACRDAAWMPYLHPDLLQCKLFLSPPALDTTWLLQSFDDKSATSSALQP